MVRRRPRRWPRGPRARSRCEPSTRLLINFAEKSAPRVIIRGLRAVSDFEYEFQMVGMNQRLNPRSRPCS